MVSTSWNKRCKILFCLGEIEFFSIMVFFLPLLKLCGSQFLQKNFITPSRNCFSGQWKTAFSIYQIFQAVNSFSPGKRFYNEFRLVKTNFLSSRNNIVLFRALLKIWENSAKRNLFKRNRSSARGNWFFG